MGAGVRIAADQRDTRQREAEFGSYDMDDAVAFIADRHIGNSEGADVLLEPLQLPRCEPVRHRQRPSRRRHRMIGDRDMRVGAADDAARLRQAGEGLRATDLLDEMAVDIEQGRAVAVAPYHVVVPDLVVKRTTHPWHPIPAIASCRHERCYRRGYGIANVWTNFA